MSEEQKTNEQKLDNCINQIINADCLDILRQLPDQCIDLVLTVPPYGLGKKKNTTDGKIHGLSKYNGMGNLANTYLNTKNGMKQSHKKKFLKRVSGGQEIKSFSEAITLLNIYTILLAGCSGTK